MVLELNRRCLLKYLCYYCEVQLEFTPDCLCNIAKALKNARLELVAKRGALSHSLASGVDTIHTNR